MIRGYKIRIYPTTSQETVIWDHIHACRFMWNYMLELQNKRFDNGEKYLSANGMTYLIKEIKNQEEYVWLQNISSGSLGLVCRILHRAYDLYFRKIHDKPKFKSKKRSKTFYPVRSDRMWFDKKYVTIDKIGKVKYKTDYDLPIGREFKFGHCEITYNSGKYMLSFTIECENQAFILSKECMGIDLGIKDLAVVAFGNNKISVPSINRSRKIRILDNKMRYYQSILLRKISTNKRKSKNYYKIEDKYIGVCKKISNIRDNYIHQTTHTLVNYFPSRVIMETLIVSKMGHDRNLRRMIRGQCFNKFIKYMKYKCEWRGIEFIQADRYFPSSKTCSQCGAIKSDLSLSDRIYTCNECGLVIDRDYNAAINLMRYTSHI